MLYGILSQHNPEYLGDTWAEIDLLYEGGYRLLDNAKQFLPKLGAENPRLYEERLRDASYLNYLGRIVDFFVASLFTQEIVVTPAVDAENPDTPGKLPSTDGFYPIFSRDCDKKGTPFQRLMRDTLTTALKKRRALVAVDLPSENQAPPAASLAEEEASGKLRAYAFEVPIEQLIDWEYDDDGAFAWTVLHRQIARRSSITDVRGLIVDEFKTWERDPKTGAVSWTLYRTEPHKTDKPPSDKDEIPVVDKATTTFRRVPLVELALPHGLWVGNKIGCLAREHFSRRSGLISAENKSLFAALVAYLGPEISAPNEAMPAEVQQNPNRAKTAPSVSPREAMLANGIKVLGRDDKMAFVEPTGHAYEIVDKQLDRLVDEMFRVTDQMSASVASTSTALGRSGASKSQDRESTEIVLGALGSHVRDLARRVYGVIAEARGETVIWTPHGLDKYELTDRDSLLKEATAIDAISIPSVTFKQQYKTKLAFALVGNIPPETQEVIRQEIADGVHAETELNAAADEHDEPDGDEPEDEDDADEGDDGKGDEKKSRPPPFGKPKEKPGEATA